MDLATGRGRRRVGRGDLGASPDQDVAPLIDRQALALDEFVLQIFQGRIIQLKLALQGAVGQASAPLEHGYCLIEDLLKGHRPPSLYQCSVQQTVWEWEKPCGRMYTADG